MSSTKNSPNGLFVTASTTNPRSANPILEYMGVENGRSTSDRSPNRSKNTALHQSIHFPLYETRSVQLTTAITFRSIEKTRAMYQPRFVSGRKPITFEVRKLGEISAHYNSRSASEPTRVTTPIHIINRDSSQMRHQSTESSLFPITRPDRRLLPSLAVQFPQLGDILGNGILDAHTILQ